MYSPRQDWHEGVSDFDIDAEDWDACFHASLATAGGAAWDGMFDEEQRRHFWQWYLEELIEPGLRCPGDEARA